jgi:subtilase family serine protease
VLLVSRPARACRHGNCYLIAHLSAATPLVAGMIALWNQQAKQGLPRPGFVPPVIHTTARSNPGAFINITQGGNALFGGSCCPGRRGYDLATGLGSPKANQIAAPAGRLTDGRPVR